MRRRRLSLPVSYDKPPSSSLLQPTLGITSKQPWRTGGKKEEKRSRCEEDFIELEKLGRGGYGTVYAVRNKLDGLEYAMKKIQFKNTSNRLLEKVLREVKMLALLNHPNVVRYHSAWLERDELRDPLLPPRAKPMPLSPSKFKHEDATDNEESDSFSSDEYSSDDEESPPFAEKGNSRERGGRRVETEGEEEENWTPFSEIDSSDSDMEQFNLKLEEEMSSVSTTNRVDSSSSEWEITGSVGPHSKNSRGRERKKLLPKKKSRETRKNGERERERVRGETSTTLFIVMQLYTTTLAQWLDRRSPTSIDTRQNIHIFRQICRGLQYIHSKGVIHRDLKPGNIFISPIEGEELLVCLGDFGLAIQCSGPPSSPPNGSPGTVRGGGEYSPLSSSFSSFSFSSSVPSSTPPLAISIGESDSGGVSIFSSSLSGKIESSPLARSWEAKKHTAGVGTLTYSSPEMRGRGAYNEKTDIYSLGIIFFELCYPCVTKMERARVLADLRGRILPKAFLQKYPAEAAFVMRLISPNPEDRPSVEEILRSDLMTDEFVVVGRRDLQGLNDTLWRQQAQIKYQQDRIKQLELKIAQIPVAVSDTVEIPDTPPEPSHRSILSSSAPLLSMPIFSPVPSPPIPSYPPLTAIPYVPLNPPSSPLLNPLAHLRLK